MATFDFEEMFGDISADDDIGAMPIAQEPITVLEESKPSKSLQAEHPVIVLCLDCSGSMAATDSESGQSRIELVKRYASDFVNTNLISGVDKEKVELCVVAFDSNVTILKDFAPMTEISSDFSGLQASGLTVTYSALTVAVNLARRRRNALMEDGVSCFKPIIFVVTDGRPEGDDEMREACHKVLAKYVDKGEDGKAKMRLIICGIPGCDMKEMNALCKDKQLIGLADVDALDDAFKLLTASVAAVSGSVVTDDVHLAFDKAKKLLVPNGQGKTLNLN